MSHAKVYHYYLFAQGLQIYLPNQGGQNYHFKLIRGFVDWRYRSVSVTPDFYWPQPLHRLSKPVPFCVLYLPSF